MAPRCLLFSPAVFHTEGGEGGGGGGGGGYPTPKVRSPTPRISKIKSSFIMILTQPYNLQSDLPVLLFKNVKDFIKIDST